MSAGLCLAAATVARCATDVPMHRLSRDVHLNKTIGDTVVDMRNLKRSLTVTTGCVISTNLHSKSAHLSTPDEMP